ncbi:MAG TPA: hypothetical protein VFE19_10470 [Jatrophihabitantaceae bacterium]|nr:hypothetical protein [Jatrophihabitantaceae bacterium]
MGNRAQLLDEIVWWRARRVSAAAVSSSRSLEGVERIVAVVDAILRGVMLDRVLRRR